MRLLFFLGGLTAGALTTFRIPHLPEAFRNVMENSGPERMAAAGYICVTLVCVLVMYFCVKEVFAADGGERAGRNTRKL